MKKNIVVMIMLLSILTLLWGDKGIEVKVSAKYRRGLCRNFMVKAFKGKFRGEFVAEESTGGSISRIGDKVIVFYLKPGYYNFQAQGCGYKGELRNVKVKTRSMRITIKMFSRLSKSEKWERKEDESEKIKKESSIIKKEVSASKKIERSHLTSSDHLKGKDPDVIWDKTYGGKCNDYCSSMIEDREGNFVLAGYTCSYGHKDFDFYVIKLDKNGNQIWTRTFGGMRGDMEERVIQMKNGYYIVIGTTYSFGVKKAGFGGRKGSGDAWIIRLDKNGNLIWERTFGQKKIDRAKGVTETDDGAILVTGHIHFNDPADATKINMFIIKLDPDGNKIWDRMYAWPGPEDARKIIRATDGGYIILLDARHWLFHIDTYKSSQISLMKIDEQGNRIWQNNYGGINAEVPYDLIATSDGGYAVVGLTGTYRNTKQNKPPRDGADYYDIWLIKVNSKGKVEWTKIYGSKVKRRFKTWFTDYTNESGRSIIQTPDKGFLIAANYLPATGSELKKIMIVKTDRRGKKFWEKRFTALEGATVDTILRVKDGSYVLAGELFFPYGKGLNHIWVIKFKK